MTIILNSAFLLNNTGVEKLNINEMYERLPNIIKQRVQTNIGMISLSNDTFLE